MAYMSSFHMKNPPSDGEMLDDWEQMADSGVSWVFSSWLKSINQYGYVLAFGKENSKHKN